LVSINVVTLLTDYYFCPKIAELQKQCDRVVNIDEFQLYVELSSD